jgi:peptidoglycan hydrolase CwlO-like protein
MEPAPSFHFRHRVGNLNWKLISSLDIDAIVEDHSISELQSVLDNITFCDFTPTDVRNNSIDSVSKVVKVMQLIIEYLLHCQENQYKTIQSVHKRNSNLKSSVKSLHREIAGLKEDSVIYQRQLSILRHSLSKAQDMIRENKMHGPLSIGASQVVDPSSKQNMNMELMNSLLDQHRATYMKDIEQMMANSFLEIVKSIQVDQNKAPSNELIKANPLSEFREHVELMLKESLQAMERKTIDTLEKAKPSTEALSMQAMLLAKQTELYEREQQLNRREEELLGRELALKQQLEEASLMQRKSTTAVNTDPSMSSHASSSTSDLLIPKAMITTATSMTAEMMDLMKQRYSLGFKLLIYFHRTSKLYLLFLLYDLS